LPSRWWCSSWSVSAGVFFLDLFCGGIVSCFSAETRWAPMLGVSENSDGIPKHERKYSRHVQVQQWRKRRQRTSQRLLKPQELCHLLHVPSRSLL
jgi:hypothetical protein